jgi:hypothetical protein
MATATAPYRGTSSTLSPMVSAVAKRLTPTRYRSRPATWSV